VRDFAAPSDKVLEGDLVRVPDVGGLSESDARATLTDAGFSVSVGRTVYSTLSRGNIASTSPGAGSKAMRGSDVTINPSAGYVPAPPAAPPVQQEPPAPKTPTPTTPTPTPTATASPKPEPKPEPTKPSPTPTKDKKGGAKPGPKPKATTKP
jgi:beta-lactam-binding protein with PASTA domain